MGALVPIPLNTRATSNPAHVSDSAVPMVAPIPISVETRYIVLLPQTLARGVQNKGAIPTATMAVVV